MRSKTPPYLLKPGEIHAWLYDLDEPAPETGSWEKVLFEEERERSKRYHFEQERSRFIARRGILRQLLAKYTRQKAEEIVFATNPYGKLSLPAQEVKFSLASCQEQALYVFTLAMEVGVDIEKVRPLEERERIVETWFSADEQAGLRALMPEMQTEAFYHTWTQKEAFLKARGEGFNHPLQSFSVSVDPNKPGEVLAIGDRAEEAAYWKMYTYAQNEKWRAAACAGTEEGVEVIWKKTEQLITSTVSHKEIRHNPK